MSSTHPFFDMYLNYTKNTEPNPILHRWSIISAIATMLGRRYYITFGSGCVYPNLYILILGESGSRKSTAIKGVKKLLALADYKNFAPDRSTKEIFLEDLVDGYAPKNTSPESQDEIDAVWAEMNNEEKAKECFIPGDEFYEFIGENNSAFCTMLGSLWDSDEYKNRLKNSRSVVIKNPCINILGGMTHAHFQLAFPPETLDQGFISRVILVYAPNVPEEKKIAFPEVPPQKSTDNIVTMLRQIRSLEGEARLSKEAKELLGEIYYRGKSVDDIRLKTYSTRRHAQLLKLCLVCSAVRLSTELNRDDVFMANTILTYTESKMGKALGEFGLNKNSVVHSRILQVVRDTMLRTGNGTHIKNVWKQVANDFTRYEDFISILNVLTKSDKLQTIEGKLYPKEEIKSIVSSDLFNFNLLKEFAGA